jgi:hypothetical protein
MQVKIMGGPARPPFGRRELFDRGWIEANRDLRISCFVRDVTPEGARVLAKRSLPARFQLFVEAKAVKANCQIVDEGEGWVDVRFL